MFNFKLSEEFIDKALLLILLPAFFLLLFIGLVALKVRGGRPFRVMIRGVGVHFQLDANSAETATKQGTKHE